MKAKRRKKSVTLCVLKPDAYERGIIENIINDLNTAGFETTNFVQKSCL